MRVDSRLIDYSLYELLESLYIKGHYYYPNYILFSFNNEKDANSFIYNHIVKDILLSKYKDFDYRLNQINDLEKEKKYIDLFALDDKYYIYYYPVYEFELENNTFKYKTDPIIPSNFLENLCFI